MVVIMSAPTSESSTATMMCRWPVASAILRLRSFAIPSRREIGELTLYNPCTQIGTCLRHKQRRGQRLLLVRTESVIMHQRKFSKSE